MANKDSKEEFSSVSGQAETAEPSNGRRNDATGNGNITTSADSTQQSAATQTQSTAQAAAAASKLPAPTLKNSSSSHLTPIAGSPLLQSPRNSRTTSPVRQDKPLTAPGTLSTQPSAAAIQRALSASNVPQLQQKSSAVSDVATKLPGRGPKSATASGDSTPSWPVSPRLKSPPPSGPNSRRGSAAVSKKPETSGITVLGPTLQASSTPSPIAQSTAESRKADVQLQAPPVPKVASRGPSGKSMLETVQENASDTQEPSPAAIQAAADLKPLSRISDDETKSPKKEPRVTDDKQTQLTESGSESAGNKSDSVVRGRQQSTSATQNQTQSQPPKPKLQQTPSKASYSVGSAKARQEAGQQNMTVETETVQSIPQSGLAPAREQPNLRADNPNGTIKSKPSHETIRPKKERKKTNMKTRSVTQGTGTSKADLFEARVANAVDEANTSDSDETFVYESNPPEPQRRQRHHSRTPSVTSSHSMADQQRGAIRGFGEVFEDRRVGGKRSMKFSTNPYNQDVDSPTSNDGTVRSNTPRHIGRFGRGGIQSATYDPESPFTQARRLRENQQQSTQGRSRPSSPRSPQGMQSRSGGFLSSAKKQEGPYEFDAAQNADDERTPLVMSGDRGTGTGTVRNHRSGARGRHMYPRYARGTSDEYDADQDQRWCCKGRVGACFLTTTVVVMVVICAVGFVFSSNRPLYDVNIHKIHNVLASEQELIMDLVVGAVNPNTLGVSISDMDVDIFAKSKHVGPGHKPEEDEAALGRRRKQRGRRSPHARSDDPNNPSQDPDGHWKPPGGDADDDLERDSQTMLLGRIFHFDQALMFEASPIKQHEHVSSGQVRLTKPGNKTEAGGSARWEQIIQYPFELIVRGVLKYQLPISARLQSAAVGAKIMVHPEEGLDHRGNMRVSPIDHSEHWQWIDWPGTEAIDANDDDESTGGERAVQ